MQAEIDGLVRDMWFRKLNFMQRFLHLLTLGWAYDKPPAYELERVDEPGADTIAMGDGPERSVLHRIVFKEGEMSALTKFLGRRNVQIVFRVSSVLMFVYLLVWGVQLLFGGDTPSTNAGLWLLEDARLEVFTLSRLTDVPGILLFVAAAVAGWSAAIYISDSLKLNELAGGITAAACIVGLLGAVVIPLVCYVPDGGPAIGAFGVLSVLPVIFVFLGSVWGFIVGLHRRESLFPLIALGTACACCCVAVIVSIPAIVSGVVAGLFIVVVSTLVFAAGSLVLALLARGAILAIHYLASVRTWREIGGGFKRFFHWVIATDADE